MTMTKNIPMPYEKYREYALSRTPEEKPKFDALQKGCQYPDLEYEEEFHNKLDLYLPRKKSKITPLLIYVHGGAFTLGTKRYTARPLVMREYGYAVAMVEYTTAAVKGFPLQIRQVKQAVAFLREQAGQYGYDPEKIALYGESAGGNLAALAGVTGNEELFGLPPEHDYRVQAVVTDFAPINFAAIKRETEMLGRTEPEDMMSPQYYSSLYLGGFMQKEPELVPPTNPEMYITDKCPPFFIQHGMEHMLPYLQAVHFAQMIKERTGEENVFLSLLPGVGGGDDPQYFTGENTMKKIAFLNSVFDIR